MLGSHLSIAGSLARAPRQAEALGMETVQVFTKNQQQWAAAPLDPVAVAEWHAEIRRLGWTERTVAHASYLINLASPDDDLWSRSVDLMVVEVQRCDALSIPFLVHHPGAHTTGTRDAGLDRIARAYRLLLERTPASRTICCLENTAGGGSTLGRRFEELADLRERIVHAAGAPARVGFCFDTCHAHAAGYDISARARCEHVLAEFDRVCGLALLRVVHVNDSRAPAGSGLDRHAHIGEGTIGGGTGRAALARSGFAAVMNHPGLGGVPMILETPKVDAPDGTPMDRVNLSRLRELIEGGTSPIDGHAGRGRGPARRRGAPKDPPRRARARPSPDGA